VGLVGQRRALWALPPAPTLGHAEDYHRGQLVMVLTGQAFQKHLDIYRRSFGGKLVPYIPGSGDCAGTGIRPVAFSSQITQSFPSGRQNQNRRKKMTHNNFEWKNSKQLSIIQFLLATCLPSGIAYVGFRVVLPNLVKSGTPILVGWPAIASIMLFVFVLLAIFLLRSEAKQLGISLWERMCFKRLSGKEWGIAIGLFVIVKTRSDTHGFKLLQRMS